MQLKYYLFKNETEVSGSFDFLTITCLSLCSIETPSQCEVKTSIAAPHLYLGCE
jgi:hypothetical protein